MPFDINKFHSNVSRTGGLARSSDFEVFVTSPSRLITQNTGVDTEHLTMRIESANIPQRASNAITHNQYGPVYKQGGPANYLESTMNVILSSDLREREFFLRWQDLIVGNSRQEQNEADIKRNQFDIGYYKDYTDGSVEIRQYSADSQNSSQWKYKVKLIEAYPSVVGPVESDWQQSEISRMSITWQYRYFVDEFRDAKTFADRQRLSISERINQSGLGGVIGTVGGVLAGRIF